jgi:hypothetical protein
MKYGSPMDTNSCLSCLIDEEAAVKVEEQVKKIKEKLRKNKEKIKKIKEKK